MNSTSIFAAIALYVFWGTVIALLSRRGMKGGVVDYFLANRQLKGLVAALSYSATTFSAFMMLGLAGLTYTGGVGAYGFEMIYLSGLILAVVFGPLFWKAGKIFDCVSPAELLSVRYRSRAAGAISALISIVFLVPYASVQLMGIGYLLETLSGGTISFAVAILLAVLLSFVWTEIAGLRSVATTDSLQAGVMMASSCILVFVLITRFLGGIGGFIHTLETQHSAWLAVPGPQYFSFHTFLGLSLPWFFFSISNPQVSQRLFVPVSLGKLREMIGGFLIFGFIFTVITIILGFSALELFPGLPHPDQATPTILAHLPLHPLLVLGVMLGIFSAAISTIDSIFLTLSSMLVRDVLPLGRANRERMQLFIARLFIPILCLTTFLFAFQRLDLIAVLSVVSSAGLLALVPSTFGVFFWKKGNAQGAVLSMGTGALISFLFHAFAFHPLGFWPGVWTIIIATLVFILASFRSSGTDGEDFMRALKKWKE